MGAALAAACIQLGHEVVMVSGPVSVEYPAQVRLVPVVTTDEMLQAAVAEFDHCDGAIGAAAPCDYQPRQVSTQKIAKTGEPLLVHLVETADIVATLGQIKRNDQWVVGFALETDDRRFRSIVKLEKKHCDLIVSNGPDAIDAIENAVELIAADGSTVGHYQGTKQEVARLLAEQIDRRLIRRESIASHREQRT